MSALRVRRRVLGALAAGGVAAGSIVAAAAGPGRVLPAAAACTPIFSDPSSDGTDITGTQQDQLDIVAFDFGLDTASSKLRVVMTMKNLSTTIPTGSNSMSYTQYWTFGTTNYA